MKRIPLSPLTIDILIALSAEANHGYGLLMQVRSDVLGAVLIEERSVYKALDRMTAMGLVAVENSNLHAPLQRYELSPYGRRMLVSERGRNAQILKLLHERL